MLRVVLVPIDARLAEALEAGPEAFAARMGPRLGEVADLAAQAVRRSLALPAARPPRWGGFLAMSPATAGIVGACALIGPPETADGMVEMTVWTFPPFERRGFATAMAAGLMARAKDAPEVRRVIAHTPPGETPSARILRGLGLDQVGESAGPDGRPAWRWEWVRTTFA
ncbi:GNAT family N-acetyltransferase [Novispirillum sp. DQ9]|uniref:GNAT family N-acetyltransferase n=1 Tax=Novispirillum sp. DQ9 TaxID=3398612 RepID=UPI003C7C3D8B